MSGVAVGRVNSPQLVPYVLPYLVANSMIIEAGDWVVLAANSRVRKLTAADIAANYTETNLKGILGMAMHSANTDANGASVNQSTPTGVVASAPARYALPNYSAGLDPDPVTGVSRIDVAIANDSTDFAIRLAGAANAAITVTHLMEGLGCGLQVVNTTDFSANNASAGAAICAVVSSVIETDPNFNVSSANCQVLIKIKPAYQQFLLGLEYL